MCNRAVSYSRDVTLTLPHFGVYSKQYMYQDIYVHGTILSLHDIIVVCSYLSWWLLISTVCIFCLYFREKKSISIFETSREATASLESSLQALECRFSRSLIKSRTRVIVAHPWPFKHNSCISILGASYYTTLASCSIPGDGRYILFSIMIINWDIYNVPNNIRNNIANQECAKLVLLNNIMSRTETDLRY